MFRGKSRNSKGHSEIRNNGLSQYSLVKIHGQEVSILNVAACLRGSAILDDMGALLGQTCVICAEKSSIRRLKNVEQFRDPRVFE